jgi:hypothetical protein
MLHYYLEVADDDFGIRLKADPRGLDLELIILEHRCVATENCRLLRDLDPVIINWIALQIERHGRLRRKAQIGVRRGGRGT